MSTSEAGLIPSGIRPLDERVGGLEAGGTYVVVGAPGPAKMVTALQFVHAGVSIGEPGLLLSDADASSVLDVSRAWGLPMDAAWEDGTLQILGFREDFELRALRSIEPGEILEELDELVLGEPRRISVDPGALFLTGGAKTLLGSAFMAWARRRSGTFLTTLSVDGDAATLPSSAEWLVQATTARLTLERRTGGLHQITLSRALPGVHERDESVTLALRSGEGLVKPDSFPARRGGDRAGVDRNRLLLLSLDPERGSELRAWAGRAFDADVVEQALDAVARVHDDSAHGCVLVHSSRSRVREAVQACRALRPLTRAAIVFTSDDSIRSTDRIHLLEAGADDCLSGGADFRELGVRIRQAMATDARAAAPLEPEATAAKLVPEESDGGRVTHSVFAREIERRAADADSAFFCVLEVATHAASPQDLQELLAGLVRSDEGDIVAVADGRCLVLLQGAREGQLGPFVERLRDRVAEEWGRKTRVKATVLGHPAAAPEIEQLMGMAVVEQH